MYAHMQNVYFAYLNTYFTLMKRIWFHYGSPFILKAEYRVQQHIKYKELHSH